MIYKEAELGINPEAGGESVCMKKNRVKLMRAGTPLCPFDCDCCF